jgi:hypothetical protein
MKLAAINNMITEDRRTPSADFLLEDGGFFSEKTRPNLFRRSNISAKTPTNRTGPKEL